MKLSFAIAALFGASAATPALAYDINDWPTHYTFSDGTDIGVTLNYQYDINDFSGDDGVLGEDISTNRRKEFGFTLKKKGVYDATAQFDFQSRQWLDVFLRLETKALFGADYGKLRFGYSKTPVGFEGITSARAPSFLETALPVQAVFAGRRTGIDWALERPNYILNFGYYFSQDLQGDNDGTMIGGRFAWTPVKADGHVLHLGVAGSVEDPDDFTNGKGQHLEPASRVRARPEAGLTPVRLVDSGSLTKVDTITRTGLEGLWINGPWSIQGEYLSVDVQRDGFQDYTADGFYVFGSWVLTGESRPYSGGNVNNIKPKGDWGAWELLARYSTLDLNDGGVYGGKEHDWTLGVNWYLTQHFKFQANYVRASAEKGNLDVDPRIVELRAQIFF